MIEKILTTSEFYKLLDNVTDTVESNISKIISLDFDKIIAVNPNLKFIEVEFKSDEYKLIRNNQESNLLRVLTDYNGNMKVFIQKCWRSNPYIQIIRTDQDTKNIIGDYSFILDSYYIKDTNIFIEDRNNLLNYKDLGDRVFLTNINKYGELIKQSILDKRDNIWTQIQEDINILINNSINSHRVLRVCDVISKLKEIV